MDPLQLWAASIRKPPRLADRQIEGWPLTFAARIRFADIDLLGHVNNVTYGTYFEEARMDVLRWLWERCRVEPSIIVARLEMDFRRPLYLADEPVVAIRVGEMGNSRFDLHYLLYTDRPVCEGRTVNVWYDYEAGRPAPLPAPVRAALEELT